MTRILLVAIAWFAGFYAIAAALLNQLPDAGLALAACGAATTLWGLVTWRDERRNRMRRARKAVWDRREREYLDDTNYWKP